LSRPAQKGVRNMISFGVVSGSKTVHLVCFYIHTLKTHFYGVVSGSVSGSVLEGVLEGS
jgi:hypothetical protein